MSKPWRSASIRGDELLLSKKFSCCFCLNVVTASFFIGVTGFISCVFYLLVSVLASFTYNIIPAAVGVLNYGFLIVGQFTKRPCFYLIYIITNLLGIVFYTLLICFLIAMLIWMPTFYVEFVAKNIERDTHTKFSLEACRNVTIINSGVYLIGILVSSYATWIVYRAYKFVQELNSDVSSN